MARSSLELSDESKSRFRTSVEQFEFGFARGFESDWGPMMVAARPIASWVATTREIPERFHKDIESIVRAVGIRSSTNIPSWWKRNRDRIYLLLEAIHWPRKNEKGSCHDIGPFRIHDILKMSSQEFNSLTQILLEVRDIGEQNPWVSKAMYGDIFVVGHMSKAHHLAWYKHKDDEIFVRFETKTNRLGPWSVLHEIGHRWWYHFMTGEQKKTVYSRYKALFSAPTEDMDLTPGSPLPCPLRGYGGSLTIRIVLGDCVYLTNGIGVEIKSIQRYLLRKRFPTIYASKSPEEYWAESFSAYLLGKLQAPHSEMIQQIVGL